MQDRPVAVGGVLQPIDAVLRRPVDAIAIEGRGRQRPADVLVEDGALAVGAEADERVRG